MKILGSVHVGYLAIYYKKIKLKDGHYLGKVLKRMINLEEKTFNPQNQALK